MSIYKQTLKETLRNKQLRLEGKHIAIPFPFPRFSEYVPGILKRRYYLITANSKVGKTKITDFLFVLNPFLFKKYVKTNIKPRIKYFSLEMSKEDKIKEVRSFLLFHLHGITMPPDIIDSVYQKHILSDDMQRILESDEFYEWFEEFESMVEYIDYTKNPYGIYKHIRGYAHSVGKYIDKQGRPMDMSIPLRMDDPRHVITNDDRILVDQFNKNMETYEADDPDAYDIIVVDHARLLQVERGVTDTKNIENFSSNYLIHVRDRWNFIPVMVQQQAASQESLENDKADRLRPSADGLGISKNTQQDCDTILGLFSPARHNKASWERYDITKLKDSHREFEVLLNRRGNAVRTQLYFNGAANFFKELPPAHMMTKDMYERVAEHKIKSYYI